MIHFVIIVVVAISLGGVFIIVCMICLCKRYGGKTQTPEVEHSELNDLYGQYEFDDEDGGVVRLGSVWGIDKSPQYGEAEQGLQRNLTQVRVMDRNPEYSEL